jgi:hypothetical protein
LILAARARGSEGRVAATHGFGQSSKALFKYLKNHNPKLFERKR